MTNRLAEVAAAALILAGAGTAALPAQQKPDFSGEYVLNRQASTLSPVVTAVQSGVVRIEHREPRFRYQTTLIFDGKPTEYSFEILSDGREVTGTVQGRTTASSLRWDGDALVFISRIQSTDSERTVSFRYELLEDRRRLRAVEQLRGGGREQDNTWISLAPGPHPGAN